MMHRYLRTFVFLGLIALPIMRVPTAIAQQKISVEQAGWVNLLLDLDKMSTQSELVSPADMQSPQISVEPTYEIPLLPDNYDDLKKILEKLKSILNDWPWKKILEQYDHDHDGKLSPAELREFLKDRAPCVPIIFPCEERDKLIDTVLCYFLKGEKPGCNLDGIEISPALIEDWLARWLQSVEAQIQFFCSGEHPDPARCDFFKKLKELIEDVRRKFQEGVPCPPPVNGCDCGCAADCPCRHPKSILGDITTWQ
jgi:hypothetical protein